MRYSQIVQQGRFIIKKTRVSPQIISHTFLIDLQADMLNDSLCFCWFYNTRVLTAHLFTFPVV
jgi:hypothetical protein